MRKMISHENTHSDEMSAIWPQVATFAAFKIITSILIFAYFPSWYTFFLLIALSVLWFVPIVYFIPVYTRRRFRLWLARARRKQLLDQEWHIE